MISENYSLADFIEYNSEDIFEKAVLFYDFTKDFSSKRYYTYLRPMLGMSDPRVRIYDNFEKREREMIMLASNNYLGLASRPEVIEAGKKGLEKYGSSLGGSPLLCGYSDIHRELETQLADFKGCEDAVLFPSGFATNLGAISSLIRKNDVIFSDRLNHASIIDGCIFSGAAFRSFPHNDIERLESLLTKYEGSGRGKIIIVEGVYSMDGDICPLDKVQELALKYKARLMVDEAHSTGVLGKNGRGAVEHHGLEGKVDLIIGTFSKSFASQGGFVCSTKEVVNYIRGYGRSYFFSASLSPVIVACVLKALEIIKNEPELRIRLWENITYIRENLQKLGFNTGHSNSAIIPVMLGSDEIARKINGDLSEMGLFVNTVFFPAVPQNQARLRISLMATHQKADLDEALSKIAECGRKYGII